ncbi:MAG: FAD-dependent oxidoreductase [Deltaproteobacteria bacterium]|jgi:NADH dehydrogenase FAD-containing subunit|nr:FAD-dependent oxidoreductase [Deltaproteobacteria bacterium]
MEKHLVLVGGGHAHMVMLSNLHTFIDKGHTVTVIGPSDHHYYSGMGPGMLGRTYSPAEIRFATRQVVEKKGGTFILGKAVSVDPEKKAVTLESGECIPYDVVSFNAGSYVPRLNLAGTVRNVYAVKPIERLMQAQEKILELVANRKITIGILGGGPSAAEIAGNLWQLTLNAGKNKPAIKIFAGKSFMARFPEKVRSKVAASLTRRGIEILTNGYAQAVENRRIILETGEEFSLDVIFLAMGVTPNAIFRHSNLATGPDGGLLVNEFLQSTEHADIFGGGDCIYFQKHPLDKVGVYAVRQNPVLYHNVMARLEGQELQPFNPGGGYLLIFNLGGGKGLLRKKWITVGGRMAFIIKDYIDRKFMRKFQALED